MKPKYILDLFVYEIELKKNSKNQLDTFIDFLLIFKIREKTIIMLDFYWNNGKNSHCVGSNVTDYCFQYNFEQLKPLKTLLNP